MAAQPDKKPARRVVSYHSLFDGARSPAAAATAMSRMWLKRTPAEQLGDARAATDISLIETLLNLRRVVADFKRRLTAVKAADQAELDEWLKDGGAKLADFVSSAWVEYYTLDNVVAAWRVDSVMAYTIPAERCTYLNYGGIEKLSLKHGLTHAQIDELFRGLDAAKGVAKALKDRYKNSDTVRLGDPIWNRDNPDVADFFRVLRRDQSGKDFGRPRLAGLLREADSLRSLSIGDAVVAYAGRRVIEHHKLGYAVTTGNSAGTPDTHIQPGDDTKVQKVTEGKQGLLQLVTNFDHGIGYFTIDPAFFKAEKWAGLRQRVVDWAGPVGLMFMSAMEGEEAPNADRLLQAEVTDDRARFAAFLEPILNGFTPVPVKLEWSDDIFVNFRLWLEAMAKGVAAGLVSIRSYHEAMGLNHDRERERKLAEKQDKDLWKPLFDAAHGDRAGLAGDSGGRPLGALDP